MELSSWLTLATGHFATGLFLFTRFSALFFSAPPLSSRSIPNPVRLGLAAVLASVVTPLAPAAHVPGVAALAVGAAKEAAFGAAMGFTVAVLFAAVQMAGEWLDLQAGFQAAQLLNPAFDTHSAPLGNFKYMVAGLVFFGVNGHAIVLRAAVASVSVSGPGAMALNLGAAESLALLLSKAILVAIQLAAPVAAALFLAEIAIALASKALPSVNMMMLTLPAKSLLGLSGLALAFPAVIWVLRSVFGDLGVDLAFVMKALSSG